MIDAAWRLVAVGPRGERARRPPWGLTTLGALLLGAATLSRGLSADLALAPVVAASARRAASVPPAAIPAAHRVDDGNSSQPGELVDPPERLVVDPADQAMPNVFMNVEVTPIDMATALRMADVQNPQFLLAQQRVAESAALRQLAATQWLPTINLGTSYDGHTGNLQQSNGNILDVKRNSLYIGAGAVAIAAGTVNIPGLVWNNNPSVVMFNYLVSQQNVVQSQYASAAQRNAMGLRVATAYLDLLAAEGRRSILLQLRTNAVELAQLTRAYAKTGQGRFADANRAACVLIDQSAQAAVAEGDTLRASARLAQLLNLDPSLRLHPTDNWVVPHVLVPESMPLSELLAVAVTRRPELAERQAAVRSAFLSLRGARLLPFSPTIFLGLSGGAEAGGSNLVSQPAGSGFFASGQSRFGDLMQRTDEDYMAYWTLKNIGLGNRALIDAAAARLTNIDWQRYAVFEQARMEVANAYVVAAARLAQLVTNQEAVAAASDSWREDIFRIRANEGLPIEAVNSLDLLTRSRLGYLDSIVSYNQAQFDLYVALGQPPADALARSEPPPPEQPIPLPPPPVEQKEGSK